MTMLAPCVTGTIGVMRSDRRTGDVDGDTFQYLSTQHGF
jgi:hypothetical protein